jgi:hypothetical protein
MSQKASTAIESRLRAAWTSPRWTLDFASRAAPLALTSAVLTLACQTEPQPPAEQVRGISQALTVRKTLAIDLPSDAGFYSTALGATQSLRLADGVRIVAGPGAFVGPSGFAGVANIGAGEANIGADAQVGDTWSQGPLVLRERAVIHGFVHAAGQVVQQNGVVMDGAESLSTLLPANSLTWNIDFVVGSQPVNLEPDQQASLDPGGYGDVSVKSRATLRLSAGQYFLRSLSVEPQATLSLDTTRGGVFVYVTEAFSHKGTNNYTGDDTGALFGYFGSSTVALESAFNGTVVAPNAAIYLAPVGMTPGHRGSFYGKSINVEAWTKVTFAPFKHVPRLFADAPKIDMATSAGAPPPLTTGTLATFIDWALRATPSDMAPGRIAIAQARGNAAVADALVATFRANENGDMAKALVILGVLGELQSAAGEALFTELLHRPVPPVGPRTANGHVSDAGRRRVLFYQAKAAHGLGYMPTESAAAELRGVMKNHADAGIRAEAVRTYTFGQSAAIKAEIRAYLNPEDKVFVDRFENRNLTGGAMTFDAQLAEYISQHPEVMP